MTDKNLLNASQVSSMLNARHDDELLVLLMDELRRNGRIKSDILEVVFSSGNISILSIFLPAATSTCPLEEDQKRYLLKFSEGIRDDVADDVRIQALLALSDQMPLTPSVRAVLRSALSDPNIFVRNAASVALQQYAAVPVLDIQWGDDVRDLAPDVGFPLLNRLADRI